MEEEIVSVDWLSANLNRGDLVILDASPKQTISNDISSFSQMCIPNSRPFNIGEKFINKNAKFPNTVPSESQFERECRNLGINQDSDIVIYDNLGIYTSPRAWWLFKLMGHAKVRVLNGGLPEWVKKGYPTTNCSLVNQVHSLGDIKCKVIDELVISYIDIITNIESNDFLLIDARSTGRFDGTEAEPRKNLKSGSIPKSVNIPYQSVLENGKFKSKDQLKEIFTQEVPNGRKLVFSCGSGMTACIVMLASEISFERSNYLYDGSWTEYAIKSGLARSNILSTQNDFE